MREDRHDDEPRTDGRQDWRRPGVLGAITAFRGLSFEPRTDDVDEILASDLAAGFAYVTPARGVVISPMAPLALRDQRGRRRHRDDLAGDVEESSIGSVATPAWPSPTHAREHGLIGQVRIRARPKGRASFPTTPDRDWLESITPEWERFLGPRFTGLAGRILEIYYWQRVPITIQVERIVVYPDDAAASEPKVLGKPPAVPAAPQRPPGGGTAPRVDATKVAAHAQRLPHTLLGWCGSDDMPEVVPAAAVEGGDSGVKLSVPTGSVPPGGRRAALTSHQFQPRLIGQEQRVHTGWLESDGSDRMKYAPHTKAGYRLPASASKLAFILATGSIAFRMKKARETGLAPAP